MVGVEVIVGVKVSVFVGEIVGDGVRVFGGVSEGTNVFV
jgi:hypothetical protein